MADASLASDGAVVAAPLPPGAVDTAATPEAGTIAYLASGERVGLLMDAAWKLGLGLFALLAVVWLLGVLPGAVRLL